MRIKSNMVNIFMGIFLASACAISYAVPSAAKETVGEERDLTCNVLPDIICGKAKTSELQGSGIWQLLLWGLRIMTFGVGVAAVAALAFASFLYTTAQDSSEQTKKAIDMIRNTVVGLIVFALMWAALEFLIPGGMFTK